MNSTPPPNWLGFGASSPVKTRQIRPRTPPSVLPRPQIVLPSMTSGLPYCSAMARRSASIGVSGRPSTPSMNVLSTTLK